MHKKGIENGCVLLADKNSGEYRAMVGGFDFWDDHDGAEIPAFFVRRSSGSTLSTTAISASRNTNQSQSFISSCTFSNILNRYRVM